MNLFLNYPDVTNQNKTSKYKRNSKKARLIPDTSNPTA
jgi:hypothetical protein